MDHSSSQLWQKWPFGWFNGTGCIAHGSMYPSTGCWPAYHWSGSLQGFCVPGLAFKLDTIKLSNHYCKWLYEKIICFIPRDKVLIFCLLFAFFFFCFVCLFVFCKSFGVQCNLFWLVFTFFQFLNGYFFVTPIQFSNYMQYFSFCGLTVFSFLL